MVSCLDLGYCKRCNSERGKDYSECPAVHAEQNAIISASRKDMIGADIYIVGIEAETKSYVENPAPCSLCKRMIINSGISKVFVRTNNRNYKKFLVEDWTWNLDNIIGGY